MAKLITKDDATQAHNELWTELALAFGGTKADGTKVEQRFDGFKVFPQIVDTLMIEAKSASDNGGNFAVATEKLQQAKAVLIDKQIGFFLGSPVHFGNVIADAITKGLGGKSLADLRLKHSEYGRKVNGLGGKGTRATIDLKIAASEYAAMYQMIRDAVTECELRRKNEGKEVATAIGELHAQFAHIRRSAA